MDDTTIDMVEKAVTQIKSSFEKKISSVHWNFAAT